MASTGIATNGPAAGRRGRRRGWLRQAPEALTAGAFAPETLTSAPPADEVPDARLQGHWLLASMGKRVLRPGGLHLTREMLEAAAQHAGDRIVEFGPGVGLTAAELLAARPAFYVGIEPNTEGRAKLDAVLAGRPARVVTAEASATGLDAGSADLVVGEAMLTMSSPQQRRAIVAEAARVLAAGGRYAIHELALADTVPDPDRRTGRGEVSREISATIKVGATPVKLAVWRALLTDAGFDVVWQGTAPMRLLEPSRLIADEGPIGFARFATNMIRRPEARRRVLAMRNSFRAHKADLSAVAMVAVKRPTQH
ncbi:methyltransferase domain-containing protein [Propionibacterium freudenreichii]|uniref:class I SAM-dependent methyltransferase n=1 Tax=Propionibacterium freudenreichii TaxID=1744 RepID=UPI00254A86E0|nr:class I SAM-dependent methyltransferase [Propionibacterium freudenreichii]MDK9299998.1 methyltransferase domain-containing protein [Propionibacterium freudenreichii]